MLTRINSIIWGQAVWSYMEAIGAATPIPVAFGWLQYGSGKEKYPCYTATHNARHKCGGITKPTATSQKQLV